MIWLNVYLYIIIIFIISNKALIVIYIIEILNTLNNHENFSSLKVMNSWLYVLKVKLTKKLIIIQLR